MFSLVVSRNICFGLIWGMAIRMLVSPETAPDGPAALFVAALFGYWLFGREMRRLAAQGDE